MVWNGGDRDRNSRRGGQVSLTSHELGWNKDGPGADVGNRGVGLPKEENEEGVPSGLGDEIEGILAKVIHQSVQEKSAQQRALDVRREVVFKKIAEAGSEKFSPGGDGMVVLRNRLSQAGKARISEAESMADLAIRCGDFESPLLWHVVIDQGNVLLWKGYIVGYWVGSGDGRRVVPKRLLRRWMFDGVEVIVRMVASGWFLALVDGPRGKTVGLSSDGSPMDAVRCAIESACDLYFSSDDRVSSVLDVWFSELTKEEVMAINSAW